MSEKVSSVSILRAMAKNYTSGHRWDHLDGEACTKAADELAAALAELAALKGGRDELQAQKKLMEQALSDLWSVRIDKIKSHCMDAAPPAQASAWVPVSERLPAETYAYGRHTDDVLCRTRSGKLIIAMLARTTTGPVWYDQQSQERDVTHWQPLPAAPTHGASDGKGGGE